MAKKNEGKSQAEIYREERKARLAKASAKQAKKSPKRIKAEQTFTKVTPIVLACVLAVALVGWLLSFAGVPQKITSAMKVGDIRVSKAEYTYYYRAVAGQYVNMAAQYDTYFGAGAGKQYIGYDSSKTPDQQEYDSSVTKIELEEKKDGTKNTWQDFFEYHTKNTVQRYVAIRSEAEKAGMKLSEADMKSIDDQIKEIRETAAESNFSLNAYLRAVYGKGVSESVVRDVMETQLLVDNYVKKMSADFANGYSDEDIQKAYEAAKDDYDTVTLRMFTFETDTDVAEGESLEESAKKKETAKKDAEAKAKAMLAKIKDEKSFKDQALQNAPEDKKDDYKADAATLLKDASKADLGDAGEDAQKWAFDAARKAGDKTVISTDEGVYVFYMVNPRHKSEDSTVDVRHILLSTEEAEGDAAKAEIKKNAEALLEQWKKDGATEDAFAALASEKTEDTGSQQNGGLYEKVAPGKMVEAFDAWIFDSSRKPGDSGIVETEYGYHIMYFVKKNDEPLWKTTIKEDKASADADKKLEEMMKSDEYAVKEKKNVIKSVVKNANESFKSSAYNASQG